MCRSIKTLHNFEPPATDVEIRASALQFVRKLSGFARPSKANQAAFDRAVEQVTSAAHELLATLVSNAQNPNPPLRSNEPTPIWRAAGGDHALPNTGAMLALAKLPPA
jgi:hypothetical protein